jgi:3-isopropylmalate/(R)-2-methylmalate dehydratase small subunit
LGDQLFYDWRYDAQGKPNPDFLLNKPEGRLAQILLAGDNFGCGSSREHAPWALLQYGFRAVISTSFADIFRGNSLKNSLLPIAIPPDAHKNLFATLAKDPSASVTVDLARQELTLPDGSAVTFPIDEFAKQCLLEGVDELGYILKQDAAIGAFEAKRPLTVNTLAAA